jgi:hypothetical protein
MPFPPDAPNKIREKLDLGLLPAVPPARMWAGHGGGLPCAGCDLPILPDQVEYEFGNGQIFRMHLGCAGLWEAERRRRPSN